MSVLYFLNNVSAYSFTNTITNTFLTDRMFFLFLPFSELQDQYFFVPSDVYHVLLCIDLYFSEIEYYYHKVIRPGPQLITRARSMNIADR